MPVVKLELNRFLKQVGASKREVVGRLPFLGLDIESSEGDSVRVEYSPNRPDYGTDYGIARGLRGLLGLETGLPVFRVKPSGYQVSVDPLLKPVRPVIACATVSGLKLDDEDLRQLLSLQEDLHNGIGRGRKKLAIGLHDLRKVSQQIRYVAESPSFSFVPLGLTRRLKLSEILSETEQGRKYSGALPGRNPLPLLVDSNGTVLSFPPIINGDRTRVTTATRGLFVDVTGTEQKRVDEGLAIVATTLAEMGGIIGSVQISERRSRRTTPDLKETTLPLDVELVKRVTGLDLSASELRACLRRSRLDASKGSVLIPRYRIDMMHPVDVAEEVALGYGFDKIGGEYPASGQPGAFNQFEEFLGRAADGMAYLGMTELITYELVDERSQFLSFGRPVDAISVESPRSLEHSILRDSVIPSLMSALSINVKEEYPQHIFEIGRCYRPTRVGVKEWWSLGALSAHSRASYTEAKSFLDSFLRTMVGSPSAATPASHWAFAEGRTASVSLSGKPLGCAGEVRPEALDAFGLGVPVCGFEIDVTALSKQLK